LFGINTVLPIVNDINRVIVNETDRDDNETGPSDEEKGDPGSDNGNVTLLLLLYQSAISPLLLSL
jgi:hypothetical protein